MKHSSVSWKPKKLYCLTDLTLGKFQIGRDRMWDTKIILLWAAKVMKVDPCNISLNMFLEIMPKGGINNKLKHWGLEEHGGPQLHTHTPPRSMLHLPSK